MIDFINVFKNTNAYKILEGDKENNRLSHAYLFLCNDKTFINEYVKIIAKIIMCDSGNPCLTCRDCDLIEKNAHSDVLFYPKGDKGIVTEDVEEIIGESFIKPIEGNKKLFVLRNAETMNLVSQNKLLKTLEEPPKNVYIILSATSDAQILPTIKSRVKKIELSILSDEIIFNALKKELPDEERLVSAIACGDGTIGKAFSLYGNENLNKTLSLCKEILIDMKTSREVLYFSNRLDKSGIAVDEFISTMEIIFSDLLKLTEGKGELVKNKASLEVFNNGVGFTRGGIIHALEKLLEGKKRKFYNQNGTMLTEWILFQILEGKHKWQKL